MASFLSTYGPRCPEAAGVPTMGVGKISNIFCAKCVPENVDTEGKADGMKQVETLLETRDRGLVFCNLIDFDMLYGHRRDVRGFGHALEEFDQALPEIKRRMREGDLLLLTADHGNDLTFRGTDHTREYIPVLAFSPNMKKGLRALGDRESFADLGATVAEALLGTKSVDGIRSGESFLSEVWK